MAKKFIRTLSELEPNEYSLAGPKASSLARLQKLGLPVPPGVVLLATAFDAYIDHNCIRSEYEALVSSMRSSEASALAEQFTALFAEVELPPVIEAEVMDALDGLGRHIAVRSSATVEDAETAAWAGQLETALNTTRESIVHSVERAWHSLFSARALSYAQNRNISLGSHRVAVVLQAMVNAYASGVLFTISPINPSENQMLLEAVFGLGEALVHGDVTPDTYWIDRANMTMVNHRHVAQERQLSVTASEGTSWCFRGPKDSQDAKLSAQELDDLTRYGIRAEHAWGAPLDIEWCLDDHGKVFLLQARPITTIDAGGVIGRARGGHLEQQPVLAKSITRGWSVLFCQMWHEVYTREFVRQFGWGLTIALYEGSDMRVNVYRPPSQFVTGMNTFIRDRISEDPQWLEAQAQALIALVDDMRTWIEAAIETPLAERTTSELLTMTDEFFRRNVEIGPRYVLMLWFPIQMESQQDKTRFERAIATAVITREATHIIGGMADDFARRLATEALHRQGLPEFLARVVPIEMLRAYLQGDSEFDVDVLHSYSQCFLVAAEGVLHEDVHTYAVRKGVYLQEEDDTSADENIAYGMSAFPGKARGHARLVRGPEDFPSFLDGNVLLTSMTTPDFEQVLARAAGIVTDEGGVTSHAAILARELQIPTVIGTRTATRIFSDGDLLEVNADDGLVQKLPIGVIPDPSLAITENASEYKAEPESRGKQFYWWIAAVVLVGLSGLLLISDNIVFNSSESKFWHSAVVFTDVAAIGTFLSAVAGCVSAAIAVRVSRKSKSPVPSEESANASPKGNHATAESSVGGAGMGEAEYRFLKEFMDNIADGKLDNAQTGQILSMLSALKSSGASGIPEAQIRMASGAVRPKKAPRNSNKIGQ